MKECHSRQSLKKEVKKEVYRLYYSNKKHSTTTLFNLAASLSMHYHTGYYNIVDEWVEPDKIFKVFDQVMRKHKLPTLEKLKLLDNTDIAINIY